MRTEANRGSRDISPVLRYTVTVQHRVGTSGWQYSHWRGVFYPEGLKQAESLAFYGRRFDTLEINTTFYRDVKPSTYEKWANMVSNDFLFSVKMSRYITHIKRLAVEEASVRRFTENALTLAGRLGAILIQLPPGLAFDGALMEDFFGLLRGGLRYAVEARNKTFVDDRFFSILEEHKIAWCIADSAGRFPYHEALTAPFVYIRLHGSEKLYASSYTDGELARWADRIQAWNRPAFVYFDNDYYGHAVKNALTLKSMLARA